MAINMYAVKINTKNTTNGNPRRGWLVFNAVGALVGFADDAYRGRGALWAARDYLSETHGQTVEITELASLEVPVSEYREARKHELQF